MGKIRSASASGGGFQTAINGLQKVGSYYSEVEERVVYADFRELFQGQFIGGTTAGPLDWRARFLMESAVMVSFALFCALAPSVNIQGVMTAFEIVSPAGMHTWRSHS